MGLVVIQPNILVSKLLKIIKTKFLHCTGYLNPVQKPYKARFIVKYVLKGVSFGSKDCTKELKLESAYILGQTS